MIASITNKKRTERITLFYHLLSNLHLKSITAHTHMDIGILTSGFCFLLQRIHFDSNVKMLIFTFQKMLLVPLAHRGVSTSFLLVHILLHFFYCAPENYLVQLYILTKFFSLFYLRSKITMFPIFFLHPFVWIEFFDKREEKMLVFAHCSATKTSPKIRRLTNRI